MSLISNYNFNKLGRIGSDTTDNTQRNLQNTKFANYSMATYFSETITDDNIRFATQQPTMIVKPLHDLIANYDKTRRMV